MNELAAALQERTFRFALRTARFLRTFSDDRQSRHIADQLFRSSSGTAYNYRRACRGQSHRDFTAKLATAHEEADESVFWLAFTKSGGYATGTELAYLLGESKELLAILTASVTTAQDRQQRNKRQT
jgi:four helix bundle protein